MAKGDNRGTADELPYEVGRGKPPKHTQFKKGEQRAKRGGRPRKLTAEEQARRSLKEMIEEFVTIREGNRTMRVTAFEAYVRRLRADALSKGSIKAGREWIELSTKFGALFSQADTGDVVAPDHKAIVARFIARTRAEDTAFGAPVIDQPATKPKPKPSA